MKILNKKKRKQQEEKISRPFSAFIVFVLIILTALFIAYFYLTNIFEYEKIKMDVTVGDHIGLNLNSDAVHFGTIDIKKTGEITREVVITNSVKVPKKIYLFKTGSISRWISPPKTAFLINPWQNETIAIKLSIPAAGVSKGNYSGNLIIISKKI
ncbi:hypothetical protein HYU06_07225 [Candidatus Woesearchaeota archaeon]|nr:hypothetical protein [Candidatus Woesearchaeota archaeon]